MTKTWTVEGMHCQHCAMAVKKSVTKVSGVGSVDVDLSGKKVTVTFDPTLAGPEQIAKAIEAAGYKVAQ